MRYQRALYYYAHLAESSTGFFLVAHCLAGHRILAPHMDGFHLVEWVLNPNGKALGPLVCQWAHLVSLVVIVAGFTVGEDC